MGETGNGCPAFWTCVKVERWQGEMEMQLKISVNTDGYRDHVNSVNPDSYRDRVFSG